MRKSTYSVFIASLVIGLAAGSLFAADAKVEKEVLDERAKDINEAAKKPGMAEIALKSISTETGVPRDQVEGMYKHHKNPSGILIACVLADETKRPAQDFLEHHASGKSWTSMAHDHHVPLEKINGKLAHLEKDLAVARDSEKKQKK
jgi:hypothetical protein